MPKRPVPPEPSSSSLITATKRKKDQPKALKGVRVYVVDAKLDQSTIAELQSLVVAHADKLVSNPSEADIIVTTIRMKARLERHVDWSLARQKAVVTPQWLRDSVAHGSSLPCEDYAALSELRYTTRQNCPACGCSGHQTSEDDPEDIGATTRERIAKRIAKRLKRETPCTQCQCDCIRSSSSCAKHNGLPSPPSSSSDIVIISRPSTPPVNFLTPETTPSKHPSSECTLLIDMPALRTPAYLLPPSSPVLTNMSRLRHDAPYACQRASPLKCPNQDLVDALNIIKQSRNLEGESRSELSYMRGIAVIKAQPRKLRSRAEVAKLPFIGTKLARLVEAFVETGSIPEVTATLKSQRYKSLSLLSSIYGIGPTTARLLYGKGVRTLEDLQRWYDVDPDAPEAVVDGVETIQNGNEEEGKEGLIRAALGFRADLEVKIPRDEVEEMAKIIRAEFDIVQPGCVSTICGGYRRGKPLSNDVDIVFTHPNPSVLEGLCKRIVIHLVERGLVTYVLHYAHARTQMDMREHHFDALEKALALFVLPSSSTFAQAQVREHGHVLQRRLDIIFARPEQYWCAVVGWSGSTMFQRDLRWWAKHEKEMKFDSAGITRRRDTKIYYPRSEVEVFQTLGLEYIAAEWRNADA